MHRVKSLVFGAVFVFALPTHAERYYVTQDGFGNVDAEKQSEETEQSLDARVKVPTAESAVVGVESPESDPSLTESESAADKVSEVLVQTNDSPESSELEQPDFPIETSDAQFASVEGGEAATQEPKAQTSEVDSVVAAEADAVRQRKILSPFERAFLESEGQNPYDATAIDESLYVDSQDLLEGKVTQKDQQPFFITRDQDGNESVTFYSPSLAVEAKNNADSAIRFTEATIYSRSEQDVVAARLPADADPVAVQILLQGEAPGESYFEGFVKRCCERLPKAGVKVLEFGRSELLSVDRDLLPYRFTEGDSRYLIIRLPESSSNYPFELRSFIHRYKQEAVESGVFFPQLITLNKELKPMRVIADPVLEYIPETWSGYGYLRGFFEIDRTEDLEEEYILINTTRKALKTSSEYFHPESPITVQHMKFGSLGVKALPPEPVEAP